MLKHFYFVSQTLYFHLFSTLKRQYLQLEHLYLDINLVYIKAKFKFSTIQREFPISLNGTTFRVIIQTKKKGKNSQNFSLLIVLILLIYTFIPSSLLSKYIPNLIIPLVLHFPPGPQKEPLDMSLHLYSGLQQCVLLKHPRLLSQCFTCSDLSLHFLNS